MQSHLSHLPSDNADNSIAPVFVGSGVSLFGFLILIILLA